MRKSFIIGKIHNKLPALIIFILCCILLSTPVYAKISKKRQHKLYVPVMKKYAKRIKKPIQNDEYRSYYLSHYKVMYVFADIDKNGIDECIISYRDNVKSEKTTAYGYGYKENTTIYTLKKGKVKVVVNNTVWSPYAHDEYLHVFKKSKYIVKGFISGGQETHDFYAYNKGRLSKKPRFTLIHLPHEDKYFINNKSVSKSRFTKKYNSLTNNGRGYRMKIYK